MALSSITSSSITTSRADRRRRRWSTPARLRGLTALVGMAALIFAAVASLYGASVRSGFDAIGHTDAPQVVAADDLSYSLNDMDANLANVIMVGDKTLGPGISRDAFTKLYEQDRAAADHDLELAAARAGTDGPAAIQVRQALDALGSYEALAAQVMFLDAGHPGRVPGQTPADETALFGRATDLMQQSVLPAAKAVTTTNADALEASYQSRHGQAQAAMIWIGVAGFGVTAALLTFHSVLRRRTQRLISPFLAVATVLTVGLTVWLTTAMSSGAEDLHSAKKDAFDSVAALSAAKALSTDANADESRFLVDPGRAAQYQDAFLSKSQQLMDVGAGTTIQGYDAAVKSDLDAYFADPIHHPVSFGGYLGTELKNITFPGERAAAEKLLTAYQTYELDDRELRRKAVTDLQEAVRFDTSPAPSDSDGAFNAYSSALNTVTDINQQAFDQRIAAGLSQLGGWPWIPLGGAGAIIVLTVLGVRPRLAEYR